MGILLAALLAGLETEVGEIGDPGRLHQGSGRQRTSGRGQQLLSNSMAFHVLDLPRGLATGTNDRSKRGNSASARGRISRGLDIIPTLCMGYIDPYAARISVIFTMLEGKSRSSGRQGRSRRG